MVASFSRFGHPDISVPVRGGGFRIRTPSDFRVDNEGLIKAEIVGRFESPDSATVDADVEIDATRLPSVPRRVHGQLADGAGRLLSRGLANG